MDKPTPLLRQLEAACESAWIARGARVLHVGCKNGGLTRWLADRGLWVVGLDPDDKAIERARTQNRPGTRIDYFVGAIDCGALNGPFEAIVAPNTPDFADASSVRAYVDTLARVTLPGARVIQFHELGGALPGSARRTASEVVTTAKDLFGEYFDCERVTRAVRRGEDASRTEGLLFWLTRRNNPPALTKGQRAFVATDPVVERAEIERLFAAIEKSVDIDSELERRRKLMAVHLEWLKGLVGSDGESFAHRVELDGIEEFEGRARSGRGVLVLNSHFGAGRAVPLVLAHLGYEVLSIEFRPLPEILGIEIKVEDIAGGRFKMIRLHDRFVARALAEARVVLRRGGIVHLAADGTVGGTTMRVPFLGQSLPLPMGFAYLATTTEAAPIPVFASLTDAGALQVFFETPLDSMVGSSRDERMRNLVTQYATRLADRYRSDPLNAPRQWDRHSRVDLVDRAARARANVGHMFQRYETSEERWRRDRALGSVASEEIADAADHFFPKEGRALVVGCGDGKAVHLLSQRGLSAMGIDLSTSAIAHARDTYGHRIGAVEFYVLDAPTCALEIGEFDVIVDLMTFASMGLHATTAVAGMFARSLVPGGKLLLFSPVGRGGVDPDREKALRERTEKRFESDFDIIDVRRVRLYENGAAQDDAATDARTRYGLAFRMVRRAASSSRTQTSS